MGFLRVILLATVMVASISAISVTKNGEAKKALKDAVMKCATEDKDCTYLAFNTYRHYFPDNDFVKATLAIQDSFRAKIDACEEEDKDCGALKAYAFSKLFPDSEDAAAKDHGLDLTTEENKKMVAEISSCMSDNPLCKHLIITTFCEADGEKDEKCQQVNKLDQMFETLIEGCEGRMGKFCKKLAEKSACKLFPVTCSSSLLEKFAKKAEKMAARKESKRANKKELKEMIKAVKKCEATDKDCSFLVFRTYRHFFPASEFVKKATAFEDSIQAAIGACEDNDSDCAALKAYAFSKVFPDSEDAKKQDAGLDLEKEDNKKFAAEIETCLSSNPLCTHIVISQFCTEDDNADSFCQQTLAADEKFEGLIEKCEGDLGNFCKKIAKKGACKVFKETCDES